MRDYLSPSDRVPVPRKRLQIDRRILALVAAFGVTGAIRHILHSDAPHIAPSHIGHPAHMDSHEQADRSNRRNSLSPVSRVNREVQTGIPRGNLMDTSTDTDWTNRAAQARESQANARAVTAQDISESWVNEVSAVTNQSGTLSARAAMIQADFIKKFGPDIGAGDTNYNDYCNVARWDTNNHYRDSYPSDAVLPVWERLYADKIHAWLQSNDEMNRERAFVLTLGLELRLEPEVNPTMPSALDIAMGRNDSAINIGRLPVSVSPNYEWVLELLNAKIAADQERRHCSGIEDSPRRERAGVSTILYSLVNFYPTAVSHLPVTWWNAVKKSAVLQHLQEILAHFGSWRGNPRTEYETALTYVNALTLPEIQLP